MRLEFERAVNSSRLLSGKSSLKSLLAVDRKADKFDLSIGALKNLVKGDEEEDE